MVQRMILPVHTAPKEAIQPDNRNAGVRDGDSSFEKVMERQNELQKPDESSKEISGRQSEEKSTSEVKKVSEEKTESVKSSEGKNGEQGTSLDEKSKTTRDKNKAEKTITLDKNIPLINKKGEDKDSLLARMKQLKKSGSGKRISGESETDRRQTKDLLSSLSGKEKTLKSEKSGKRSEKESVLQDLVSSSGKESLGETVKEPQVRNHHNPEALQLQARTLEGKDDKKKNVKEIEISVIDKRTGDPILQESAEKKTLELKTGKEIPAAEKASRVNVNNPSGDSVQETHLYLKEGEVSSEGGGGKVQAPVTKEAESLFDRYMKGEGSRDISRNIRFVMKDNNQGEIKLILKPESLGRVKINLNLTENSITGRILVENNSVRNVFQDNLQQLSRMLEEQGYDSAKLDVAVDQHSGNGKGQDRDKQPFFSERLREEGRRQFDANIPGVQAEGSRPALDMIA